MDNKKVAKELITLAKQIVSGVNWRRVKRYMERTVEDHVDSSGTVDMTDLAMDAAEMFDIDEELDDRNSKIWDIAADVADEYQG